MIGLGETFDEVVEAMKDLRENGVDICTIGQYLQPTPGQVPVAEFVPPERFERLEAAGENLGLRKVVAGPFVRSSYRSSEIIDELTGND